MNLTRTAPTVTVESDLSATTHRNLLLAADELLEARFNKRSWLVFTCAPQLELGDLCIFGTPSNLSVSGAAYSVAAETPPDPTSGDVLSTDTSTQVIWLSGYSDTITLNRRTVEYPPGAGAETWWVGTVKPQRFEPLRIADICVEDYTDPVTGLDTEFTFRSHWDKYGCIRIHNGNRTPLKVRWEDASQAPVQIPPYGIICGRRPNHDEPFQFDSSYLPLTLEDDPLTWVKEAPGQTAASMETLTGLVSAMSGWCRFHPVLDTDSTAIEKQFFKNATPTGTDMLWDWLWHKGKLLSVVLDRRDGTTTIQELEWRGLSSIPDATWNGIVSVDIDTVSFIRFWTEVTPPTGATEEEWEHDLIPITTNLTGGQILQLTPVNAILGPFAGGDSTTPYTDPLPLGRRRSNLTTVYSTKYGGATTSKLTHYLDLASGGSPDLDKTLNDYAPSMGGTGAWVKSFGAIGRWEESTSSATMGISEFPMDMLTRVNTSGAILSWLTARFTSYSTRRRFVAGSVRQYHAAGYDSGGSAIYDHHPQEEHIRGTPDGLGGPVGLVLQPVLRSKIAIEGAPWIRQSTDRGADVFIPGDLLHTVATNIQTPGWWATNRDRILAGTFEVEDQLISWRVPRLTDEWNALAAAINAVQEVHRADIRNLYRDPLPDDVNHPPWSYAGEHPFAVPADWICGRYDNDDDRLTDWGSTWGVDVQVGVPDVATLETIDRMWWSADRNADGEIVAFNQHNEAFFDLVDQLEIVNGYTFHDHKFWDKETSRLLFGGAGATDEYRYVTHTAAEAVFGPLGVFVPPPPAGERYDPVIELDASLNLLSSSFGSGTATSTSFVKYPAMTAYRHPNAAGTWLQVWHGAIAGIHEGFRIIDHVGSQRLRFWTRTGVGDPADEPWAVFERVVSTACVENNEASPRRKTCWNAAHDHASADFYFSIEDNAWRSGVEIHSIVPVLVIASPELWTDFAWDSPLDPTFSPPNSPGDQYTIYENPWTTGGLKHHEFAAGTITPQTLRDNAWNVHGAYHCQVLQRTGVLRA